MTSAPTFSAALRRSALNNTLRPLAKQGLWALALLAFALHTIFGDHEDQGPLAVLLGTALLFAGLVWAFVPLQRTRAVFAPGLHPFDQALRSNLNAPITAADLDASFAGRPFQPDRLNVSRDYVAFAGSGRFMVKRLEDIVWVYTERVTHRLNAIIPYRVSSNVTLWDRFGNGFIAPIRSGDLGEAERELSYVAPWLQIGYTEVRKDSWNADRAEFVAFVDQLRASYLPRP